MVDKNSQGFPLTDLKKLPISFSGKSAESFKVNNLSYQVTEDLGASASDTNNKHTIFSLKRSFRPLGEKISRFYSIHEVVDIPEIQLDKVVVPRQNVPKIKKLRMRHFPTGYGADDYQFDKEEEEEEEEESENDDVEAGKVLKKAKVEEKRREGSQTQERQKRKRKTRKTRRRKKRQKGQKRIKEV